MANDDFCCSHIIEQGEKIVALADRQTKTEKAVNKIFDRMESNRRWQIGLILTALGLLVEGIGLIVAIVHYAKP
ncbi:hypothetical protein G9409_08220 [Chlorobium sp. BLA1]|uniref:hypothetical protein n=1 Tax=Candidatus Chlorobium masyuteum TaxID=2716876 RepID=UPI001423EE70|nr:hypothetical protein [Candidatus Chlorobium masyuteum]NHQ60571.1 hypothetical protein [Candidatus Chlorobium masyuteum]